MLPQHRVGVIKAGKGLDRYISGETIWRDEFPLRQTVIQHWLSREIEDLGQEEGPIFPNSNHTAVPSPAIS